MGLRHREIYEVIVAMFELNCVIRNYHSILLSTYESILSCIICSDQYAIKSHIYGLATL